MRKSIRTAAVAAIVAIAASCSPKVAITAHRGYWNCEEAGYAENSIKSLELAQKNHFWGSEFDVHITSDLVLVVHHDRDIKGVNIQTHDYADFKDYRLKNGEKLPTLDEYLTQGEKGGTVLVFELKSQIDKAHEDYMVDKSIEALKRHGLFDPKKVICISCSRNICERIAALCPGFTNQYLEKDLTPDEVAAKGVNGIDYHYSAFQKNPGWVSQAHKNKMSVNVWTVD
ncbi:MAG: glycerophosphodiester phosphodiesterase, partial [Bacteroidales bacterium]|nr:glycerophosphodiester phosphodiesterase [Bacteroidales bacterium]